jgi:CRP/FNR family transcriptional regulator, dissimilatory nitrate respiration regulator
MTTSDVLSRSELFGELPAAVVKEIAGICREVKVSKGEVIFRIGDLSKDVFLLAEGSVELGYGSISADESKPGTIREPGDFFGWGALAGEGNYRLINAMAVQETRIIIVNGVQLMNLLEGQPVAGFRFIRKLLAIILNRIVSMAAT